MLIHVLHTDNKILYPFTVYEDAEAARTRYSNDGYHSPLFITTIPVSHPSVQLSIKNGKITVIPS